MIKIIDKKNCCGCTACASICAHGAISMLPDSLGFLYPVVDASKCINCGLCENVCSFNDHYDISANFTIPKAFAVRHKDLSEIMKSRSGASFAAISDWVFNQGGVVYGVGYKDHFVVAHKKAININERDEFRGSKYVQSDLRGVYAQVKKDLKGGYLVLFSGTPCQTAGLASFVGNKFREKLILVDIVCHGVPAPYIWRDYIDYLEQKHHSQVINVDFRNKKKFGWRDHRDSIYFANGEEDDSSWYSTEFYKHLHFRPSCGVCHFCNLKRPSDFTLGDFWGLEYQNAEFNSDNKGASLLLINTPKGLNLFQKINDKLNFFETSPDIYTKLNPNLRKPLWVHPKSDKFAQDYTKKGFSYIFSHDYDKVSFLHLCFRKVKVYLKRLIDR